MRPLLLAGAAFSVGAAIIYFRRHRRSRSSIDDRFVLVTNFEYIANGRDSAQEDLFLAAALRKRGFNVVTVHPNDLSEVDVATSKVVLFRNTGPVTTHAESLSRWRRFQAEGHDHGKLANNLQLKGDLNGKQHLLDLTRQGGYPVIEAHLVRDFLADSQADTRPTGELMIKPLNGADSVGLRKVAGVDELRGIAQVNSEVRDSYVVQRCVAFDYEVSFYFVGNQFVYALRSGGPEARWEMKPYTKEENASTWAADMAFAETLFKWNGPSRGVVRVDGVRESKTWRLLLMEVEDYNPYLSLDLLPQSKREEFVDILARSVRMPVLSDGEST